MKFPYQVVLQEILLMFVTGQCCQISNYIKTDVFIETDYCSSDFLSPVLSSIPDTSVLDCARKCSSHTDCRRLMFNTDTKDCSLYAAGENCFITEEANTTVCFRQKDICNAVNCSRCPIGYYGDICQYIIEDCSDGFTREVIPRKKLMSYIRPSPSGPVLEVKCDTRFKGKTLIQARFVACRFVNFNRTWQDYVEGFGQAPGNHWLGLDTVYSILQNYYRFKLYAFATNGNQVTAVYSHFNMTNEGQDYLLSLGNYLGDTNYSLTTVPAYSINGRPFSTYDRDHTSHNCPGRFGGGWWYPDDHVCGLANFNGRLSGGNSDDKCHWSDGSNTMDLFDTMALSLQRVP